MAARPLLALATSLRPLPKRPMFMAAILFDAAGRIGPLFGVVIECYRTAHTMGRQRHRCWVAMVREVCGAEDDKTV